MSNRRYSNFLPAALLLVILAATSGCSQPEKKDDFNALMKSAQSARASGHEDLAANCLKEAFDQLPAKDNAARAQSVNQIYPEILALATELRRSGRFSLSKTILDKAIEIEPECTIEGKKSAIDVKAETEKVGDLEINLLKRADKVNELKGELNQLKHTTKDLVKQFQRGDYELVARDGRAHLEVLRKTRGVASNAYCNARDLVVDSLLYEDKVPSAIKLLEDDATELRDFKDEDLKNADEDAAESALYLAPLLGQIASLQLTLGQYEEAEKNAERSFELAQTLGGKLNPTSASGLTTLAMIRRVRGQNKEALELSKKAMTYFVKGKKNRDALMRCRMTIAQAEAELGQTRNAKNDFDKLVDEAEGKGRTSIASVSTAMAAVFYRAQGEEKKYAELSGKAIKLASRKGESKASIHLMYETLGDGAVRMSKFSEAEGFYQIALKNAPKLLKGNLEKKIAMCKKNRSVTSQALDKTVSFFAFFRA